jgi:hypothetical protein
MGAALDTTLQLSKAAVLSFFSPAMILFHGNTTDLVKLINSG